VDFEWDEVKSDRCFRERGFDFAHVTKVFLDPRRIERADRRKAYGELRHQTIGTIDRRTFFVAFTIRGGAIRIISARRAHDHEDEAYRQGTAWH
jgi:hypothetical protein